MSAISIRDARPADAAAMARLCTQLGYPTDVDVVPARFERLCADDNARVYVAESGGTVVGLTTVHVRYTINHDAPIAQLTLLVVTTALDRAVAHTFYERLGFTHTGCRYAKDFSQ